MTSLYIKQYSYYHQRFLKLVILDILDIYIITHDHQFGFKTKHSTDMCIFSVKSIIKYYTEHNSPVYTCFLDASKAFDKVNHWTLFNKLIKRKVPRLIVRIMLFWYQKQSMCVKWGKTISKYFPVSNGVRQGGILSPKLFSMYVDDLSNKLIDSKIGCHIDNHCMNHVMYADDICIMAPSAVALQELLNICHEYGLNNDITFNPIKSVCMVFKPKYYKLYCPVVSIGSEMLEYVMETKYLGILFCHDDQDMLRQMRTLYTKSNRLVHIFG